MGPGTQYVSWIAIDDLVGMLHVAIASERLRRPLTPCRRLPSRTPSSRRRSVACSGGRRHAPVPAFALRLALGEMADATLLASQRVRPSGCSPTGYRFRFPELEGALRHVLGTPPPGPA